MGVVFPGMLAWISCRRCVHKGAGTVFPNMVAQGARGFSVPQSAHGCRVPAQGPSTHRVLAQVAWVQGPHCVLALSP